MSARGVRVVRHDSPLRIAVMALTCGIVIGWIDTRPNWDDAGVTAGLIVLCATLLLFLRPRYWWITLPCIVAPVIALNLYRPRSLVTEIHEDFPAAAVRDYQPVFEIGLSPGEGVPIVEAVPRVLPLRRAPSPASAVSDTINSATVKRLEFDSTRYQTIEPAPVVVRAPARIRGRLIGHVEFLSRQDYYRGAFRDTVVRVSPGDRLAFLQHRAEGTCFVKVGDSVVEAESCPVFDTTHFTVRADPVTRWWIHVRTPSASGWLLLSDSTARVVRRTF